MTKFMKKLIIHPNGRPLSGSVQISGAKNSALPILCASLLTKKSFTIKNIPYLYDIQSSIHLLKNLGSEVRLNYPHAISIKNTNIHNTHLPIETNIPIHSRTSILMLGPLLAQFGKASIALPKGCSIGKRPIDLHIDSLCQLGADISIKDGYIHARTIQSKLQGTEYHFKTVSVNATENLIMAATLANGTTTITNAATEPEVGDLISCLQKMGANITGKDTKTIIIKGVNQLNGAVHSLIPDRIEAGTFLTAAAMTKGHIQIDKVNPSHLSAPIEKLREAGADIITKKDSIELNMHGKQPKAVSIVTEPYPGMPTDMQAQFTALNAVATGSSTIKETIFEDRFQHVPELRKLSANIRIKDNTIYISGKKHLTGKTTLYASDIRASAALILASLVAKNTVTIKNIYHLDRGYELLEEKLSKLGVCITRYNT